MASELQEALWLHVDIIFLHHSPALLQMPLYRTHMTSCNKQHRLVFIVQVYNRFAACTAACMPSPSLVIIKQIYACAADHQVASDVPNARSLDWSHGHGLRATQ